MSSHTERVWLVTGCSTGFGNEFIKQVLERGDKAIATARNIDSIKELAELGAKIVQLDVTASQEVINARVEEAVAAYGRIDVLFANAGFGTPGPVEQMMSNGGMEQLLETNFYGCMKSIAAVMPHFHEQKSGFVLVNSSVGAHWTGTPGLGFYDASKAAIDQAMRSFQSETAELGYIKTLVVNAGFFRTMVTDPKKHISSMDSERWGLYKGLFSVWDGIMNQLHGNEPGDVSKGVKLMIDMVCGEGPAKGKELPRFMPLGSDAVKAMRETIQSELKVLEDWESIASSTDYPVADGAASVGSGFIMSEGARS